MVFLGNPEYGVDLQPIDFVAFAQACGRSGFRIEDPAECGSVLSQALATPGPVLVEAVVDPYEHVRIEQMLFDGAPRAIDGCLYPDPTRPGLGLEFKRQDAEKWRTAY